MENSTKNISTINPAIVENTECSIVKACVSFINFQSGRVTWSWCITMLSFVSSCSNCWLMFQAKNNVKSAPASSWLTLVLRRSHNVHTANHHLCSKGERNEVQMRTKLSFGRTMMWALELLRLAKKHISGRSDIEQWRNQGCSYSHYWVMLVWRH